MIFGQVTWDKFPGYDNLGLKYLSQIISWSTSTKELVVFENFTCSVLIDNRLPLSKSDYIYINEESGILILVDGFIYNQKELSNSLFPLNNSDLYLPELIFNLFLLKGPDFVKDLNGDFSICIYEKSDHCISFFRDHLGIRPFAVIQSESGVCFSTDPLGLCKALNLKEKADPVYLTNIFLSEGYDFTLLPNKEVKNVPPAHYLQISRNKNILKRYWYPEKIRKDNSLKIDQLVSDLKELLTDAIRLRVDHKFKASAHVSGGLDSGFVATLARNEYSEQRDFYGFSWSPTYTIQNKIIEYDERLLVEAICIANNINPVFIDFTEDDQILQMKSWHYPNEMVFENKVIQSARKNKVNLIFSGWGGDEFISIGNRGIDADLIKEFSWRSFLEKYPIGKPKKIVSSLLFNVLFPSFRRSYSLFKTEPTIFPYLKQHLRSNLISKKQRFKYSSRRKIHLQLLHLGHLSDRTKDWYVHGQRNGIEYRYPLLDKRIIEYMLKVPSRCLVGGNNHRILLRLIGKNILPEAVLLNKSKIDPVKSYYYLAYSTKANNKLLNEFDDFRSNPELDFVDFKILEKDINMFKKSGDKKLEEKIWLILYCLKTAHEFTKGYNHQNPKM